MPNFMSAKGGSASGGKKTITIIVVVILALGFGWYLFKISGGNKATGGEIFDLNNLDNLTRPRDVEASDHILGNPQAKNILVAYEDIQCPACKNYESVLKSFPTELKDTQVVFRHFPLTTLHKNAAAAAYAAEAASAQGKFWEWASLAYDKQAEWDSLSDPTEKFTELARQAGVADLEQFKNDVVAKKYKARVEKDAREAESLKVNGTPSLFFNGARLQLMGLDGIKQQAEKLYR